MIDSSSDEIPDLPSGKKGEAARAALNAASGLIPFAGGLLAAIAGAWSERDQDRVNSFLHHWLKMLEAEMQEKQQTILEIMARIDLRDEKTAERVESPEYQAILRKAFRDWGGTESEDKRILIRNLLSNAASSTITSDDVVKLFLDWIKTYSELHFAVIGKIYNNDGITRGEVWRALGRNQVREDSSDADLFKLLFRDLATGGIARQHRETDYAGNFVAKPRTKANPTHGGARVMKSAFDDGERYELTALGRQFVHYAMTDLPLKIDFAHATPTRESTSASKAKMPDAAPVPE